MSETKCLWLNGERQESCARAISDLLISLNLPLASLLVEHNGVALHRHEWPQSQLAEGDRIEIVRIVAGG